MLTRLALAFSALTGVQTALAATFDFENLDPSPAIFDVMPSPYGGFSFTGWYYGPDMVYTPASGAVDLFTDYADPGNPDNFVITVNNAISSATPFIFEGASFSGYSGVKFELFLNGNLVHTSQPLPDAPDLAPYMPTFLASGYNLAVDTVKVSGVQGFYAMDDFTYSAITSVPEPASYTMLLVYLPSVVWLDVGGSENAYRRYCFLRLNGRLVESRVRLPPKSSVLSPRPQCWNGAKN
jgi:hypothetical protein